MIEAFFIDGPRRGAVVTVPDGSLTFHQVEVDPRDSVFNFTPSEPLLATLRTNTMTYHLHEFVIGGRVYRLLSLRPLPQDVDEIQVIMTLIDMDPRQSRMCQVPVEARLTTPGQPR